MFGELSAESFGLIQQFRLLFQGERWDKPAIVYGLFIVAFPGAGIAMLSPSHISAIKDMAPA